MKVSELFEGKKTFSDFDAWKAAVLKKYPAEASKMKFKGRVESGKDTISAEIPGQDRSYGVWDQDAESGEVLSEGLLSGAKALAKKIGKYLMTPTVSPEEVKAYVDALKMIKDVQLFTSVAKELTSTQLQRALNLPTAEAAKIAFKAELKSRKSDITEGAQDKAKNIAKLKKDYKDAKGWVQMSKSDRERRGHELTVQKIASHAKKQYNVDLAESLLDEGYNKLKLGTKVKIVGGPKDVKGLTGHIGEIRKELGRKRTFTVDYKPEGSKSSDRETSIQLQASDLRIMEAMPAAQAEHEIKWLKNKIETLKKDLVKRPSVARQIKDLERQIKERELGQTFTESVANMHKLADAFKVKLNKKLKDSSLGFRHTRNGFENSKYSINLEIDTDDNDGFVTYSIKKVGGDKAISKSEPLDQDDSIITSIIRAVRS